MKKRLEKQLTRISSLFRELTDKLHQKAVQELRDLAVANEAPAVLARAFALGTMLSFVPVPILDTLLVLFILSRYKHVNRPALLAARVLWNDLVVLPLYVPAVHLGRYVVASLPISDNAHAGTLVAFAIGCFAMAVAAAALSAIGMMAALWSFSYLKRPSTFDCKTVSGY